MLMMKLFALSVMAAAPAPTVPKVSFAHPGVIERYCAAVSPAKPDPRVLKEIDDRIGEFSAAWAKDGPRLLQATEEIVARPFTFHETLATLHGCPDLPTMGLPLLINVVRFTRAYSVSAQAPSRVAVLGGEVSKQVLPMSEFVHDVWNEVTRRYVRSIRRNKPPAAMPLLQKYAGESIVTQRNLDQVALDQLVSERLGLRAQFEQREASVRASGAKDLIRAYDIVHAEGAQKFVDELR
jgi:hypothetical protein